MRNAHKISMFCFLAILFLELRNHVFLLQIAMLANAHRNLKVRVHSTFAVFPYLVVCERRVPYVLKSFSKDSGAYKPLKTCDFQIFRNKYLLDLTLNKFSSTLVLVVKKLLQA